MARATNYTISTKFQRAPLAQRMRGLKRLRVWALDPRDAGFRAEAARQAELLKGAPEEADAQEFIEAVTEWPDA